MINMDGFYDGYLHKIASREDAPNYSKAEDGSGKSCGNCQHVDDDTGDCTLYNFSVTKENTCDSWAAGDIGNVLPGSSSGGALR